MALIYRKEVVKDTPPFVGLDDFALRKGHQYGTLLCDLNTHEPIDILKDRKEETVLEWFKERPSIQIVTRDRSRTFRKGINRADPSIEQVSDRFHLVHNLGSLLDRILRKELPNTIKKETSNSEHENNSSKHPASAEMGYAAKQREDNALKKWELALKVKALRQEGLPYKRIGRKLNLHRTTVKKYEAMKGPPDTQRGPRSTAIHRFLPELETQVEKGRKIDDIETSLREQGYKGSYSAIRNHVATVRRKANNQSKQETVTYRKQAWKLFWRRLDTLSQREREVLNQILSLYPNTKGLYGFVQLFRDMIQTKDKSIFQYFLRSDKAFHHRDITSFINKLREEKAAILAALTYPYSNGILEGNITRLKMIKRQLYGRAGIKLFPNSSPQSLGPLLEVNIIDD